MCSGTTSDTELGAPSPVDITWYATCLGVFVQLTEYFLEKSVIFKWNMSIAGKYTAWAKCYIRMVSLRRCHVCHQGHLISKVMQEIAAYNNKLGIYNMLYIQMITSSKALTW